MNWIRKPLNVLVAGGGVAALEAALALSELAPDDVSVTLVAPEPEFVYRPLAVAELHVGRVAEVEADRKLVRLDDGEHLDYDVLLLALGARPCEAVAGALTFSGPESGGELAALLERIVAGDIGRLGFAVPTGAMWPLPIYELALLTSSYLTDHGTRGVELAIVTPELRPLAVFGPTASDAVGELLEHGGVAFEPSAAPLRFEDGKLDVLPPRKLPFDAVVALPRLEGPRVPGVPCDENGFVPTDAFGVVMGMTDVYAAGDLTQFPLKQGGIATQQADAAALSIAAEAGADVHPEPFTPLLRGLLLTGFVPRFLRGSGNGVSEVDTEPLWWPPAKIVGRYLAPFLAAELGLADEPPAGRTVPVEIAVENA